MQFQIVDLLPIDRNHRVTNSRIIYSRVKLNQSKGLFLVVRNERLIEIKFSVSHTTREARNGETEGIDYHFISKIDFEKKIQNSEFLEWAQIHKQYYGTAFDTVDCHRKNGDDILIELDVQGAQLLRNINYKSVFIFMLPPSLKELEIRLNQRHTETEDKIRERMEVGKNEIKQLTLYDYILTNFDVEETVENLLAIIRAERCRIELYQPSSPDLSNLLDNRVNT